MKNVQVKLPEGGLVNIWGEDSHLSKALLEQSLCMKSVYALAREIVRSPSDSPPEFAIRVGDIPPSFFTARKNIFSTLFHSTYMALDIAEPRRLLYGKLNHLFRIWVTGADNLLDDEDKCVLPLVMPGSSRVMREVVAIMAADRVLLRLLRAAVADKTLTEGQADTLANESLRCLLPSAGQEASEEGGIVARPAPEYVLDTIHVLKTGLLFNIPFTGVDLVETALDSGRVARLKTALRMFGGGCQILDDVRDMARDFVERRHNYVLSVLARDNPDVLSSGAARDIKVDDRLYADVLSASLPAARLGYQRLADACKILQEERVMTSGVPVGMMALSMFAVLDLEDLSHECTFA